MNGLEESSNADGKTNAEESNATTPKNAKDETENLIINPSTLMQCPVDVDEAQKWFISTWNEQILPKLIASDFSKTSTQDLYGNSGGDSNRNIYGSNKYISSVGECDRSRNSSYNGTDKYGETNSKRRSSFSSNYSGISGTMKRLKVSPLKVGLSLHPLMKWILEGYVWEASIECCSNHLVRLVTGFDYLLIRCFDFPKL